MRLARCFNLEDKTLLAFGLSGGAVGSCSILFPAASLEWSRI
jgi:hypothetical protein